MGSGAIPPNVKVPPSPFADGGELHCPETGRAAATVVDGGYVGTPGHLALQSGRVALIVSGTVVATVDDRRLRDCVRAGFVYRATLEDTNGSPTIAFTLE